MKHYELIDGTVVIHDGLSTFDAVETLDKKSVHKIKFPNGLKTIGPRAFAGCIYLDSVEIPDSVEVIGESAFKGCARLQVLSVGDHIGSIGQDAFRFMSEDIVKVNLPESYIAKFGNKEELHNYLGIPDENGMLIRDGQLLEVYKRSGKISIPEGVKAIQDQAIDFYDCQYCPHYSGNGYYPIGANFHSSFREPLEIEFPESIESIGYNELLSAESVKYILPEKYLKQKRSVNNDAVLHYLINNDVVLDDDTYCSLYLYHTVKSTMELEKIYMPYLLKDLNRTIRVFIDCLSEGGKAPEFLHAAEFIVDHNSEISASLIKEFYDLSVSQKKNKAVKCIERLDAEILGGQSVSDPIEEQCKAKYDYKEVAEIIKKSSISLTNAFKKAPVKYKDSNTVAPEFVVMCAILPYLQADGEAVISVEADTIADMFDRDSYLAFLKIICKSALDKLEQMNEDFYGITRTHKAIILIGRYADDEIIGRMIDGYNKRLRNYMTDKKKRWISSISKNKPERAYTYSRVIRNAILINDNQSAINCCYEKGWTDDYAALHGISVTDIAGKYNGAVNDLKMDRALELFESTMLHVNGLMQCEYNEPIVMSSSIKGGTWREPDSERFFRTIRDIYKSGERPGVIDDTFSPDELYAKWMDIHSVYVGQAGAALVVGILVASCMFETSDVNGEVVFCRDNMEYENDYSSKTRVVIEISAKDKPWNIYKREYAAFEM